MMIYAFCIGGFIGLSLCIGFLAFFVFKLVSVVLNAINGTSN